MTRTILTGGLVFDGSGAAPAPADVVLEDGRIVAVGSGLDGDAAVDARGATILPGLFDCHVHVMVSGLDLLHIAETPFSYAYFLAMGNLAATIRAGITSVRDAGGADLGLQRAVDDGLIPGPRMQISLSMISQTGGHGDPWMPSGQQVDLFSPTPSIPGTIVDGPDEVRRTVRALIRGGADVIKVATSGGVLSPTDDPRHRQFSDAELEVLVAEATAAGRFVMAHAQGTDGIKAAVRSGIRSIEHGIFLDDEAIDLMLARGTYLVPTLVAPLGVIEAADAGVPVPEASIRKAREVVDIHRAAFRRAVSAGVRVAMGTDTGVTPHGRNLRELALMAEGGMTPAEVLVATTRTAAELLGVIDERGTIEPGKLADLTIVEGDALDLVTLPGRIREVWKGGLRVA
jgi:imidazolonepropionase-like amidohydrolase